jgi:outer membrane receptor protein involved in Fe transport
MCRTRLNLLLVWCCLSQVTYPREVQHDSPEKRKPPVQSADTSHTQRADSLLRYSLPKGAGHLDLAEGGSGVYLIRDMEWSIPRFTGDLFWQVPGMYLADPASTGQYVVPSLRGADWRAIQVLKNGRPLNDPGSGIYNLYFPQTSNYESIEVVTGPRAFLFAPGSAGGAINLVQRKRANPIPFSTLFYSQGPYKSTSTEGTVSQNLSRRFNLTLGFQFQGTAGRYVNAVDEQWNIHGALRYHLHPDWSLTLSEEYTQTQTGLNGGIDIAATGTSKAFVPQQAVVRNPTAYEKMTRHDLDLMLVGRLLADSTDLTTLSVYYTSTLREYRDEPATSSTAGGYVYADDRTSRFGLMLRQELTAGIHHLSGGAQLDLPQVEGSPNIGRLRMPAGAIWMKEEARVNRLNAAVYTRFDQVKGESHIGFGGDLAYTFDDGLRLFGGWSQSFRPPSPAELSLTDSSVTRTGPISTERHRLLELGVEFNTAGSGTIRLAFARREVTDPILITPVSHKAVFPWFAIGNGGRLSSNTLELSLSWRFGFILLEGTGTYAMSYDDGRSFNEILPRFFGNGGVYFRSQLLENRLDLKAGVRGRIATSFYGAAFNPQHLFAVPNTDTKIGLASTVDALLVGHVGDAHVFLVWENLLNIQYFTTPYTPGLDRTIRFGIYWEFWN